MPKRPNDAQTGRAAAGPAATVAPAEAKDSGVIAALMEQALHPPWSGDSVARFLEAPGSLALLVRPGGPADGARAAAPAGFLMARVVADVCDLAAMAVAPAWRRHGLGAALLAAALEKAGAMGARQMFLEVGEANAAARALYRAQGFRVIGRRRGYYGEGVDALLMCREIGPAAARRSEKSPRRP